MILKRQNLKKAAFTKIDVAAIILRRKARRVRECTDLTRASRSCERIARTGGLIGVFNFFCLFQTLIWFFKPIVDFNPEAAYRLAESVTYSWRKQSADLPTSIKDGRQKDFWLSAEPRCIFRGQFLTWRAKDWGHLSTTTVKLGNPKKNKKLGVRRIWAFQRLHLNKNLVIRIYRHDKHDAIGNLVAILGPALKASHSQRASHCVQESGDRLDV